MAAGYYLEKKKKNERKLASLGAWLVFWFSSLAKLLSLWPNLARRRRRWLVVYHLGRSLPTQRPRLEEEYGRRSRGFSTRYN